MTRILSEVLDRVGHVIDPETSRTLGDTNLVTEVKMLNDDTIKITFVPNSPCSPTAFSLGLSIKNAGQSVEGVKKVIVECLGHMMDDLINNLVNEGYKQTYGQGVESKTLRTNNQP